MKTKLLILMLISVALYSCTKDFIEKDLSKKTVTIMAPPQGYKTTTNTLTYWWNEIDGANEYNLQIVSTSFSYVQKLVLDTTIGANKFSYTLSPGIYQWRVKALNGSSHSAYTTLDLTIDSTANIASQVIVLQSPGANYFTNVTSNTFRWDTLYNADDYRFQIINTQNSSTVIDITLQKDSFIYTLAEGKYTWQVRGQNVNSNTLYSSRSITIDLTAPIVSTLLKPINKDTVASPDTLRWSRDVSAMADSVFIYPDSLISAPVYKGYLASTSYIFSSSAGDYFWRLKSKDQSGNWSTYSTLRKFWIQ